MDTNLFESLADYEQKKARVVADFQALLNTSDSTVGLGKTTSNLFRYRDEGKKKKINVRDFNRVISVDTEKQIAEVEGMTTYERLVDATLPFGLMPTVVPELKSITIGGAATGIGIEATSFRYGFVHETITELEILLGDGRVVQATRTNEFKDLFFAFPNSYGTLGYALKLKVKLIPIKKYVRATHLRFNSSVEYFKKLAELCTKKTFQESPIHFVDGSIFNPNEMYITVGQFTDTAPHVSDYTYRHIYYKSIQTKNVDFLTTKHYIWRWDTDWFWCSKHFGAQNPVIRLLAGRRFLRSTVYWKIRAWFGAHPKLQKLVERGHKSEAVVQDVEIPVQNAPEFLAFFQKEIGISPVWACPVQALDPETHFSLYPITPNQLYINFGFWDTVPTAHENGYFNRRIEQKVRELGGKKSLYSNSFYTETEFWQLFDKPTYDALKQKYDPKKRFKNLYDKCVRRG